MGKRRGNALNAWTPIRGKDDLPTKSGKYLVTVCDRAVNTRYLQIANYDADAPLWLENGSQVWLPASWAWEKPDWTWQRVIAWRPLPKPYEGEV